MNGDTQKEFFRYAQIGGAVAAVVAGVIAIANYYMNKEKHNLEKELLSLQINSLKQKST